MKIGIVSCYLGSSGIQETLLKEGHTVKVFISGAYMKPIVDYSGFRHKYSQYTVVNLGSSYTRSRMRDVYADLDSLLDTDFVVFDYNESSQLPLANYLRSKNMLVVGPTKFTVRLEADRAYGKSFAASIGLYAPHGGIHANSIEEAISFIEYNGNCVLKGFWDTIIPTCAEDGIDFLRAGYPKVEHGIFVEPLIVGGAEFGIDFWFNGKEFILGILNREYKGAHNGTRGNLLTGESGTWVRFFTPTDDGSFVGIPAPIRTALRELAPILTDVGYKGFFAMNTMTVGGVLHFLEFTTRFGYPTELTLAASLPNYGNFLKALATGSRYSDVSTIWAERAKHDVRESEDIHVLALLNFRPREANKVKPRIHGIAETESMGIRVLGMEMEYDELGNAYANGTDRAVVLVAHGAAIDKLKDHKIRIYGYSFRDDIGADDPISSWGSVLTSVSSDSCAG